MTESQRTSKLLTDIRKRYPGAFVKKLSQLIGAGLPDAVIVLNGVVLWIEFKGPKTPITPIQMATLNTLARNGAKVLVGRFTGHSTDHTLQVVDAPGRLIPSHWDAGQNIPMNIFSYIEATCRR